MRAQVLILLVIAIALGSGIAGLASPDAAIKNGQTTRDNAVIADLKRQDKELARRVTTLEGLATKQSKVNQELMKQADELKRDVEDLRIRLDAGEGKMAGVAEQIRVLGSMAGDFASEVKTALANHDNKLGDHEKRIVKLGGD